MDLWPSDNVIDEVEVVLLVVEIVVRLQFASSSVSVIGKLSTLGVSVVVESGSIAVSKARFS